jgi:phosphatidylserine/phosphatidylglycerophosphate/cardiolipin synthase-like enzyme
MTRALTALVLALTLAVMLATQRVRAATAGVTPAAGGVSLIAEPAAGVAPFLTLIGRAHHSIELTMYELEDPQVDAALAAAARRGVDVRVLLNGGYYDEPDSTNTAAARYLAGRGVHVRSTPTFFALTHQKTLTVDGRVSAVMTLNFDGLYASTRDYAILDTRAADVAAIVSTFDADWAGERIDPSTGSGDLVWSPGAAPAVLALIDGARHSIELENEEMDDPAATDALCAAARRGVDVKIVMTYASEWRSAFDTLTGCGAHVRVYHGQAYYIHAKLLEVDTRTALVSSQNLSPTSLDDNRELGIEVSAGGVIAALTRDFAADYAGAEPY